MVTNYYYLFHCSVLLHKPLITKILKQAVGVIVNVNSIAGLKVQERLIPYTDFNYAFEHLLKI